MVAAALHKIHRIHAIAVGEVKGGDMLAAVRMRWPAYFLTGLFVCCWVVLRPSARVRSGYRGVGCAEHSHQDTQGEPVMRGQYDQGYAALRDVTTARVGVWHHTVQLYLAHLPAPCCSIWSRAVIESTAASQGAVSTTGLWLQSARTTNWQALVLQLDRLHLRDMTHAQIAMGAWWKVSARRLLGQQSVKIELTNCTVVAAESTLVA